MMHEFLDSWTLFGDTYLVGWLIAVMLGLLGVFVLARNQVFVGAALSQVSTLGVALATALGAALHGRAPAWVESEGALTGTAVAVAVAASVLSARYAASARGAGRDGLMGWLFLLGASVSIVVVSHSPHGLEEVQRLFASSIIGVTRGDLVLFLGLALITGLLVGMLRSTLLLWVMDPVMALAVGVRVARVEVLSSIWLGLAVGLSIRASGTLYTFGCLVLPALIARPLCREVRSMLWAAPLIALLLSTAGFVAANHFDFPPAQLSVALMCAAWPASLVARR